MFTRVLSPPRRQAAPVYGTCLSLAAHVTVLASLVAGEGSPLTRTESHGTVATQVGERLHWVGLGDVGEGGPPGAGAPARPPIAYVVPGHGRGIVYLAGRPGPHRSGARGGGSARGVSGVDPPPPRRAPKPVPPRLRLAALPEVLLPDPDATQVFAGVIASANDLAQRVSRPEDFTPRAATAAMAELLVHAVIGTTRGQRNDGVRAMPIPLVGNLPPRYPAALERAQVGGRVLVEFTIDSTGAVDTRTLRVIQSTHALFTEAVRSALPRLRFLPAQLGEHTVGVTVRQPFLFTIRAGLGGS